MKKAIAWLMLIAAVVLAMAWTANRLAPPKWESPKITYVAGPAEVMQP